MGWPVIGKVQWKDSDYVAYGLAKTDEEADWRLHPDRWEW
jgi:hypothetical protein